MRLVHWTIGLGVLAAAGGHVAGCGGEDATFGETGTGASGQGGTTTGASQGGAGQGGAGQGGVAQGGGAQGGGAQGGAGQGGGGVGGGGDCGPCGNQLCDPQLGCVDCLTNTDCPTTAAPICVLGSCEECGTNADCGVMEYCHPADFTCENACQNNNDCGQGDANICDMTTGTCVECIDANDCGGQLCSPNGVCVDCLTNADCTGGEGVCDPSDGECVECLFNSDCTNDQCIDKECGG